MVDKFLKLREAEKVIRETLDDIEHGVTTNEDNKISQPKSCNDCPIGAVCGLRVMDDGRCSYVWEIIVDQYRNK